MSFLKLITFLSFLLLLFVIFTTVCPFSLFLLFTCLPSFSFERNEKSSVFIVFGVLIFSGSSLQYRCLVAIVEHLLPRDYFSKTLIASQADQRVLRDLLAEKLPRLSAHFEALKYVSDVVSNSPYWPSYISCTFCSEIL